MTSPCYSRSQCPVSIISGLRSGTCVDVAVVAAVGGAALAGGVTKQDLDDAYNAADWHKAGAANARLRGAAARHRRRVARGQSRGFGRGGGGREGHGENGEDGGEL